MQAFLYKMSQNSLKNYTKPILTIDEQIERYAERGLIIDDKDKLIWYLKHVWYYCLGIYVKFFQNKETNMFQPWKTFSDILNLYKFDKKLRNLLFDEIQIIEESFKTALIRELWAKLGGNTGSFWHIDPGQYSCPISEFDQTVWDFFNNIISKYKNKNNDEYSNKVLNHYFSGNYNQPIPPVWMILQVMSFGQSIKLYRMLKEDNRILVANTYNIKAKTLLWWLYNLNNLRNKCAHGERIWNEYFVSAMQIPDRPIWEINYRDAFIWERKMLYDYCLVIDIIMKQISNKKSILEKIWELAQAYTIDTHLMWFPK